MVTFRYLPLILHFYLLIEVKVQEFLGIQLHTHTHVCVYVYTHTYIFVKFDPLIFNPFYSNSLRTFSIVLAYHLLSYWTNEYHIIFQ